MELLAKVRRLGIPVVELPVPGFPTARRTVEHEPEERMAHVRGCAAAPEGARGFPPVAGAPARVRRTRTPRANLEALWAHHHAELRDPLGVAVQWDTTADVDPGLLRHAVRGRFWEAVEAAGGAIVVTREYEHLVVALTVTGGRRRVSYLRLPHPNGLAVDRAARGCSTWRARAIRTCSSSWPRCATPSRATALPRQSRSRARSSPCAAGTCRARSTSTTSRSSADGCTPTPSP